MYVIRPRLLRSAGAGEQRPLEKALGVFSAMNEGPVDDGP